MKTSELIAALQEFMEREGDLNVRIITDHGQHLMEPSSVTLAFCDPEEYMAEPMDMDEDEFHTDDLKHCSIQAW